ncbi:protein FAR-RED IMPAIRED RESPONSE 1-like [Iris pallida]|uniref:Protein FAR1-RELATED SEQUENCE n=1 Tax=Iris pallida TaxID=29817 RepID=A0AAX6FHR3_IRIPA|nr:protein FAR-RED IMPAIRED RESPONSE 1-like [Iris pallida]
MGSEKNKQGQVEKHISSPEETLKEENVHNGSRSGQDYVGGTEVVLPPSKGMSFDCYEDLLVYYKKYAKQEGFLVRKRSSKGSEDGTFKFVTLCCTREGRSQPSHRNILKSNPVTTTGCNAKLNATVRVDGKCKVNSVKLEHNHTLSPGIVEFHPQSRFGSCKKRRLDLNDQAGVSKSPISFAVESSGHEKEKTKWLRLGVGDAEAIFNYFTLQQDKRSNFFYSVDFDEEARLRNLFWADARSRAAYEAFGDVITFDTTYLVNNYEVPFALFVGVNHHGQYVLFGCALVSDESINSYTWLFQKFLACMSGRAPKAIVTDQDKFINGAVEKVFPKARHRLCLYNIIKKIPENLIGHSKYKQMKKTLKSIVHDSITCDEFEERWKLMIEEYNLHENEWLNGLYDERSLWVPVYVKDNFWAGMSTTKRSDSMHGFFDGYVNSQTTLKQFLEQYVSALKSKVKEEIDADCNSFKSLQQCISKYDIEKQFQEVYTKGKFKEFQEELSQKMYCQVQFIKKEGSVSTYKVVEDEENSERNNGAEYLVNFNEEECELRCLCRLFEFRGILCRHVISVLVFTKVKSVPARYILERWRKDLKRAHMKIKLSYDGLDEKPEAQRYIKMCNEFEEVAELASESDETCTMVMHLVHELKVKLSGNETAPDGNVNLKEKNEIPCPSTVRRRGRPPTKGKESKELFLRNKKTEQKRPVIKEIGPNELRGFSRSPDALDQSTDIRSQETEKVMPDIRTQETEKIHSSTLSGGTYVSPPAQVHGSGYGTVNHCNTIVYATPLQAHRNQTWRDQQISGDISTSSAHINHAQGVPYQIWGRGFVGNQQQPYHQALPSHMDLLHAQEKRKQLASPSSSDTEPLP